MLLEVDKLGARVCESLMSFMTVVTEKATSEEPRRDSIGSAIATIDTGQLLPS
jgi:hypothetical protein